MTALVVVGGAAAIVGVLILGLVMDRREREAAPVGHLMPLVLRTACDECPARPGWPCTTRSGASRRPHDSRTSAISAAYHRGRDDGVRAARAVDRRRS